MLIDAHSYIDKYEETLELALEEIRKYKIFSISNSIDIPSFERNLKINERCDLVFPIFGIHPWKAPEYVDRLEELTSAIDKSPMIGEIGLDHHFIDDTSQYDAQLIVFEFFLSVAKEQRKIVNIHTKGSEREIINRLTQYDIKQPIVHWYSGSLEDFYDLIDYGAYFTIGVEVLYSDHIRKLARQLPIKQLLTETDNPGGYRWLTGEIGMPSIIKNVLASLAEIKDTTTENVIQTVQDNFIQLIKADTHLTEIRKKYFRSGFNNHT